MKKRFLSVILVLCMLMSMVPMANAAEPSPSLVAVQDYSHLYLAKNEHLVMSWNRDDAGALRFFTQELYPAKLTGKETPAELKAMATDMVRRHNEWIIGESAPPVKVINGLYTEHFNTELYAAEGTYLLVSYLREACGSDEYGFPVAGEVFYDTINVAGLHVSWKTTHVHNMDEGVVQSENPSTGDVWLWYTCQDCGYMDYVHKHNNCPSAELKDVPSPDHWAHKGIDYCVKTGLMKGTSATTFDPKGVTTRAQLVTILWRQAGSPSPDGKAPFVDVKAGTYYSDAVAWAYEKGVVQGVDATHFAPNAPLNREMLITLLYRYTCNVLGMDLSAYVNGADLSGFTDVGSVSQYAMDAMCWANFSYLVDGVADGDTVYLRPRKSATREETATLMMRYMYLMER